MLPLVQLLSQPADRSADLLVANQKTAAALLSCIQERPSSVDVPCEDTHTTFSDTNSLARLYLTLCADQTKLTPFLKLFQDHCLKDTSNYDHLCIVLCALTVRSVEGVEPVKGVELVECVKGVECIRGLLSTLTSIAKYYPTIVSAFWTQF